MAQSLKIRIALPLALAFSLFLVATRAHAEEGISEFPPLRAIENVFALNFDRREYTYVEYPDRALRLDLYTPTTSMPESGYPLVVWFHGGGWVAGNKRVDLFVKDLTDLGYAVASVQYRLANDAKWPAQFDDARTALYWLIRNAKKLDLDTSQIAVSGQSAGAHLALLLGFAGSKSIARSRSPRLAEDAIKAVIAMYPPTDLVDLVPGDQRWSDLHPVAILLGQPLAAAREPAEEASPINHVSAYAPPVFLLHGDSDPVVPLSQSRKLASRLEGYGVPYRFDIREGDGHAFGLNYEMLLQADDFLKQHLHP